MTLAEKLTQARKAAGLTQADSAEKLNVSRQAVSLLGERTVAAFHG